MSDQNEDSTVKFIIDEDSLSLADQTDELPGINVDPDTDYKIELDISAMKGFDVERRDQKRFDYWGPIVVTDKATQKMVKGKSRDLTSSGVGIMVENSQVQRGDQLIIEFLGTQTFSPFSIEAEVVNVTVLGKNAKLGLKIVDSGKLATKRIAEYIDNYDEGFDTLQKNEG